MSATGEYVGDAQFANHSYIRIVEIGSGRVVINIPGSAGYGFPNAVVDYDREKLWVFATPIDRCGHNLEPSHSKCTSACIQSFQTTDLISWRGALVDGSQGLKVPNLDVSRVRLDSNDAQKRQLPAHRWIMMLEESDPEFMINNDPDDDLTKGWTKTTFQLTNHGNHSVGCPSIRFLSDGFYYAVTGVVK